MQQQAAAQHAHQQQQSAAAQAAQVALNRKRKKAPMTGIVGGLVGPDAKKKRSASAAAAHAAHDSDSDGGGGAAAAGMAPSAGARRAKKPKQVRDTSATGMMPSSGVINGDSITAALHEATMAASAAGVVGPMSLAVLQHEPLLSVPTDAPPPRTAALYATLLYENLHVQVTSENSNVLWHLLNGYMNRMFDSRLEEEILEAAKLGQYIC